MPLYRFKCLECSKKLSKLLSSEEAKAVRLCECGSNMERDFGTQNAIVKETIDNGIMPKKVEQFANSPDLIQERQYLSDRDKKKDSL